MAECDFGDWENKTAQELQADPPVPLLDGAGGARPPPNREGAGWSLQRVCRGFETLVQNLMATGRTEGGAVHPYAGVITGLLSAYGLPRAQPYEWMCQPGCGYSVRITPSLWMRSMVMEVYQTLPQGEEGGPAPPTIWWWSIAREGRRPEPQGKDGPEGDGGRRGNSGLTGGLPVYNAIKKEQRL